MVRHRKTVHQHIKEYICGHPHCRKAFSQQASLKTHIRTHTREKPYKCAHPRCRQAFGDQSSCSRHFRDIHSGRTHFCPWCNSTNKRSGEFRKHLDKMHHIERNAVEIKIYQLPETLKVEDLERLPQFMGLPGLEMRRKMPGRSRRHAPQSASSADILQNPGLIQMVRTSSLDSLASTPVSTPALSPASVSPTPPLEDLYGDFYPTRDLSQLSFGGNDLQIDFGTGNEGMFLSPLNFAGSQDLTTINEDTGSYVHHDYFPVHNDQVFQPQGCDKPYMDAQMLDHAPAIVGNELYDHHDTTLGMLPVQNQVFQNGWQPEFTAPISRLGRLSHAQAPVAWRQ
ncbi:hypothetical protein L227DRAFT_9907 [Lentinus tigrinus ALCF2SS1-6]|uniref:C2H2-type domain-containing protein n=1 Tax=Lentinus tigrinus ALCF2SS1-6 TaxID=1328759 RepID=A0A5C2SV24_9APHY|nr:hypothetical protein L227DRAFT_9907 [Lentinus tigrinus ALCF2SS1-6]